MIIKEFHTYLSRLNNEITSCNIYGKYYKIFLIKKERAELITSTLDELNIKRR